jgi:endogenous inhibitor of DNA gyrase (YacG/DUF329 family)
MICRACQHRFVPSDVVDPEQPLHCPQCQAVQQLSGMTFIALCPECAQGIELDEWMIGSYADCPACGKEIVISPPADQESYTGQALASGGHLLPGDQLGRYRIDRPLQLDGICEDYLAFHTVLFIPCLVKLLKPAIAAQDSFFAEKLVREAKDACKLKHRQVIGIIDAHWDAERNLSYVVTEYAEGMSLRDVLAQGPICESDAVEIARELCQGLLCAEGYGILHGDLRPAKVLLCGKGIGAKLLGLGIAKLENDADLADSQPTLRNQAYSAPEYLESPQDADNRADLYSLGAVLYHMLGGKQPFFADNQIDLFRQILAETPAELRQFNPALSEDSCQLVAELMAKRPAERPQSAGEVMTVLDDISRQLQRRPAAAKIVLNFSELSPVEQANVPAADSGGLAAAAIPPGSELVGADAVPASFSWSRVIPIINLILALALLALLIFGALIIIRKPAVAPSSQAPQSPQEPMPATASPPLIAP